MSGLPAAGVGEAPIAAVAEAERARCQGLTD